MMIESKDELIFQIYILFIINCVTKPKNYWTESNQTERWHFIPAIFLKLLRTSVLVPSCCIPSSLFFSRWWLARTTTARSIILVGTWKQYVFVVYVVMNCISFCPPICFHHLDQNLIFDVHSYVRSCYYHSTNTIKIIDTNTFPPKYNIIGHRHECDQSP